MFEHIMAYTMIISCILASAFGMGMVFYGIVMVAVDTLNGVNDGEGPR